MFKTQNTCWMQQACIAPPPSASLQMEVSLQLLSMTMYISGCMLLVVIPCGENSNVRACQILFNSHQLLCQYWVSPIILSRFCIYMDSPLPLRATINNLQDTLTLVLMSQLPTSWGIPSQSLISLHKPLPSSLTQMWKYSICSSPATFFWWWVQRKL